MTLLRAFSRRHAALAMLVLALALGVRALVPAGYMAGSSASGITIELCSGVAGKTIVQALPGTSSHDHGKAQADAPCSFAALGIGSVDTVDPFLLAIAIAFVLAAGLRFIAAAPRSHGGQLRPPLRGPPLIG